jgi:hypothetical protein
MRIALVVVSVWLLSLVGAGALLIVTNCPPHLTPAR